MPKYGTGTHLTFQAGEAITVNYLCNLHTDGKMYMADSTGDCPAFIALEAIASGAYGTFSTPFPVVEAVAAGAIDPGKVVQTDADGVVTVANTDATWCAGILCQSAAAASGETCTILHMPHVTAADVSTVGGV